jgi:heme exporter protein B
VSGFRGELAVALAVARKDLLAELRGRHAAVSTLFFAAVVLLLFGFALGPDARRLADAAPGLLWLAIVFSGLLAVARLHELEAEDGSLEQLAVSPAPRRALYAGKALAAAAAMLVLGSLLTLAVVVLYGIDPGAAWPSLALTVLLGGIGLGTAGTFYAALTVRMRAREVLLPLLMLPACAPLLLAAVRATAAALTGDPFGELIAWLQLLAVFDLVMLAAGTAVYGFVLDD